MQSVWHIARRASGRREASTHAFVLQNAANVTQSASARSRSPVAFAW